MRTIRGPLQRFRNVYVVDHVGLDAVPTSLNLRQHALNMSKCLAARTGLVQDLEGAPAVAPTSV